MINPQQQPDLDLHNIIALFAIAFELKYGTIDQYFMQVVEGAYDSSGNALEDQLRKIDEQIAQLKEQAALIEEKVKAVEDLMPRLLAALGSDSNAICPDSDPRKTEFLRRWNDPVVVIDDWLRLSQSFSAKEKGSFVERMMSIMQKYDLSELSFSDLYRNATL